MRAHEHHLPLSAAELEDKAEGYEVVRVLPTFPGYEVSESGGVARWLDDGSSVPVKPVGASFRLRTGDGSKPRRKAALLVADAFLIPKPSGEYYIGYLDGDHENTHFSNLYWKTWESLAHEVVAGGKHVSASKTHCKWGHELSPDNLYKRKDGVRECKKCNKANRDLIQFRKTAKRYERPWEHMTMAWLMDLDKGE